MKEGHENFVFSILLVGLLLLFFNFVGFGELTGNVVVDSGPILADHNAVIDFEIIPDYWIEKVKTEGLLIQFPGRSHAQQLVGDFDQDANTAYIGGLEMLEDLDSRYQVNIQCDPNNLPSSTGALRFVKGQYDGSNWGAGTGQYECRNDDDHYWSTNSGRQRTLNSGTEAMNIGDQFDASMFGWSFHIIREGLKGVHDEAGNMITFNDERRDAYFSALDEFRLNALGTNYIYGTAPTDQDTSTPIDECGVDGIRVTQYNQDIRNEAILNNGILFDQADIEYHNSNMQAPTTEHPCGEGSSIEIRHPDWGPTSNGCAHSNSALCIAKAKAVWWMAARMVGWDGTIECVDDDHCGTNISSDLEIISVSNNGVLTHGQNFSIVGIGFGVKDPVAPAIWDDASGVDINLLWGGAVPRNCGSEYSSYEINYTNEINGVALPHDKVGSYIAGAHPMSYSNGADFNCGNNVMLWDTKEMNFPEDFYLSLYRRADPNWQFCGDGADGCTTFDDNYKAFDYSTGNGPYSGTNCYTSYHDYTSYDDGASWTTSVHCGWQAHWGDSAVNPYQNWVKTEIEATFSKNSDGYYQLWDNGLLALNFSHQTDMQPGTTRTFGIGGYARARSANNWRYFTDIYLDYSHARIIIGNQPTLEASTIREIQIPISDWDNGNGNLITFEANQGSFGDEETLYLFVIDPEGIVSSGMQISFSAIMVPDCELTGASWSELQVEEGTQVSLTVNGNHCDSKELSFELFENDGIFGNDEVVLDYLPANVFFSGGIATSTWIAEWIDDSDGSDSDPEFIFVASLVEDSSNNIESSETMKVLQKAIIPEGDPEITSVSNEGVLSHGNEFTIDGMNLGTKSPVEPLYWDTFEDEPIGEYLETDDYWSTFTDEDPSVTSYSNEFNRPGSLVNAKAIITEPTRDYFYRDNIGFDGRIYVNYWMRFDQGIDDGVGEYSQIKYSSLGRSFAGGNSYYPVYGYYQFDYFLTGSKPHYAQLYLDEGESSTETTTYFGGSLDEHVWSNIETEIIESDIGVSNGELAYWLNGQFRVREGGYNNRPTVDKRIDAIKFGHTAANAAITATEYFDNIYMDSTIARVVVCDQAIWNESVSRHCEIQIPKSNWDNGNGNLITFEANQGSLNLGTTYYLFVIDENGNVSNGEPISFESIISCTNGEKRNCGSNIGECSYGVETCNSGVWGTCVGGVTPITEVCGNNLDDDCDLQIDEGCDPIGCSSNLDCFQDSDVCTENVCNLGTGICELEFTTNSCNDGITCTENDLCSQGSCVAGILNDDLCSINPNCLTTICTLDGCQYSNCSDSSDDPIIYLDFNSGFLDSSGNSNHGSCINCPVPSEGQFDGAYYFNGLNNYLDFGDLELSLPLTIASWVKIDNKSLFAPIFQTDDSNHYSGAWLQITPDNKIRAGFGNGEGSSSPHKRQALASADSIIEGEWHHITATIQDAENILIYVDGNLISSTYDGVGTSFVSTTDSLIVGRRTVYGPDYLNGNLDDLRIYERVLSFFEILAIMEDAEGAVPFCSDSDGDEYNLSGESCGILDCNDSNNEIYPGAIELCDGLDNDCNSLTSDGVSESWINTNSTCGIGECSNAGIFICETGVKKNNCVILEGTDEICNNSLDDDCDGNIDLNDSDCLNGSGEDPGTGDSPGGNDYTPSGTTGDNGVPPSSGNNNLPEDNYSNDFSIQSNFNFTDGSVYSVEIEHVGSGFNFEVKDLNESDYSLASQIINYDSFNLSASAGFVKGKVYFKVPFSWLNINNLNSTDVSLYSLVSDIEYESKEISRDENFVYFSSEVNSLGEIAIIGKVVIEEKDFNYLIWVIIGILIVAIIFVLVSIIKKRNKFKF